MMMKRVRMVRRELDVLLPMFPGYVFVAVNRALEDWKGRIIVLLDLLGNDPQNVVPARA
jgi:hypothetical protein